MSDDGKGKRLLWYLRQEGEVRGPFPSGTVRRFLLLGRLSLEGEVSTDQEYWIPVREVPEVIPPDIRQALQEGQIDELHPARLHEDERDGLERRAHGPETGVGQLRQGERRRPESSQVQQRRDSRTRLRQLQQQKTRLPLPGILVVATLVLMAVGYGVYLGAPPASSDPDCSSIPAPAVDWGNCLLQGMTAQNSDLRGAKLLNTVISDAHLAGSRFDGADLRYADFTRSDISYAEFTGADMKGSRFRDADLSYADLTGADLSFADLTGANLGGTLLQRAILDHAIWTDGSTCQPASVGVCLPAVHP